MKQFSNKARVLSTFLSLAAASTGLACGTGSTTISILPGLGGSSVQASALGSSGLVTGFAFTTGDQEQHPFLSDGNASIDLGSLGGFLGLGFAVNASGQVVGESDIGFFQFHAFLFSNGTLMDLGTLGGSQSGATAINDAGQIAGYSMKEGDETSAAFLYSNGTMLSLGTLGGSSSSAVAINPAGDVAGNSQTADGFGTHAFFYSNGTMSDLGSLGGDYSFAAGLGNTGIVVGESSLPNFDTHAFAWSAGTMFDLGTLGGTYSSAYAINNSGQIIGSSAMSNDDGYHGFLYAGGTMVDLGTIGGDWSDPSAINNVGQIVGTANTAQGASHAFLWQNGTMIDLNSVLPANSGWELSAAQFINDGGRIVGYGTLNGEFRWYVMDFVSGGNNNPPVANAGEDQMVECNASVTLSAVMSSDPNNDSPLTCEWKSGNTVLGTNVTLTGSFDLGTNVLTLKVTDPCGASSEDTVKVIVADTTAPMFVSIPPSVTASSGANCQAAVPNVLAGVVAADNCTAAGQLAITQNPVAGTIVNSGTHPITVTVTDAAGYSTSSTVLFIVADGSAPTIQSVTPSLNTLWPPNHQLLPITVSVAANDNCDAAPVGKIISITANEPTAPGEIQITGDLTATLAASKNSSGSQRTYTITVRCTDASGNNSTATTTVIVPKSSGNGK